MTHAKDEALKLALDWYDSGHEDRKEFQAMIENSLASPVQEPVAWRNGALRVGEALCSVGPFGYYDMTAEQWLDWALSVVTVHAPPAAQRQWVGLTNEERLTEAARHFGEMHIENCGLGNIKDFARALEAKIKEKNT